MSETRIRWERNDDGSTVTAAHEGYVGTIGEPLFFIFEPDDRDPWWILTSSLPGLPGAGRAERRAHGDDTDQLKAEAERWLEEFTSSLGAVFGDAVAADLRSRADETDSMVAVDSAHERDKLIFTAGMRRAADLIEHGDQPIANPEPAEEAAQ